MVKHYVETWQTLYIVYVDTFLQNLVAACSSSFAIAEICAKKVALRLLKNSCGFLDDPNGIISGFVARIQNSVE